MAHNGTIHERIKHLVDIKAGGKNTVFAQKLSVSEANIRGYIKGVIPKADVLEKIVISYDVNAMWLLTGLGSDTLPNSEPGNPILATSEEKLPKVSHNPTIGKPYYDVDFLGGFNEIVNSQVTIPTNNIVIQGFEKADFWCNVTGRSMEPKINHGDIIALHKCTLEDIQYGEIYAVVLDTLRTIKILRRSSDPKKLRFVPINTTDYDEQEYPVERIMNVFEVIGSISKFF